MKGYYPINYKSEKLKADCLLLYKPIGKPNQADFADALRESLRRITYPDLILVVTVPSEKSALVQLCREDQTVINSLGRASNKVTVGITSLSQSGGFEKISAVKNPMNNIDSLDEEIDKIYRTGLEQLFSECNVLFRSPPGFIFLKPSGGRATYFLRAEAAIYDTERVHFLACCLSHRIYTEQSNANEIEEIFVDTMAISSVAYVFRDVLSELYKLSSKPSVKSFHSYGGMEKVRMPFPGKALCIISASSSMKMQHDWKKLSNCSHKEVITLITLADAKNAESALYQLRESKSSLTSKRMMGLKDLRILGENFSPEGISPKQVLIKTKSHKLEALADFAPLYSEHEIIAAFRMDSSNKKLRPIYIDGGLLVELKETETFVKKFIDQHLPSSVKTIIYQEDPASKKLANYCSTLLSKNIGKSPVVVSAEELSDVKFSATDGVLIVAAVVGQGTKLLSLSQELRETHKGSRHFLVGVQIAEELGDLNRLKNNLEYSREKSNFKVFTMNFLAIGTTLNDTAKRETAVLDYFAKKGILPKELKSRFEMLRNGTKSTHGAFLPPIKTNDNMLILRPSFALWNRKYKQDCDNSGGVLATIAATLQNAREIVPGVSEDNRLSSDAFQQVLLDPDNFARFNDGILQASLLRSANDVELDYSSSPEASHKMKTLLLGVFASANKDQGEATLEFALALSIGKLKLKGSHMIDLREQASSILSGKSKKVKLARELVAIDEFEATDTRPF